MSVRQRNYEGLSEFRPETWHFAKLGAVEATTRCPCRRRNPSASFCVSAVAFSQLFVSTGFSVEAAALPFHMNSLSLSAALLPHSNTLFIQLSNPGAEVERAAF